MSQARQALERAGVTVLERGWLSANNVLVRGNGRSALVDSGYSSHAPQTLALVRAALNGGTLDVLLNTHLHSDHCGGNAALQKAFPSCETLIPPGQAKAVRDWDEVALTYQPTGQSCPQFDFDGLLLPGTVVELGGKAWEIHGASGHDPHSVVLYEPKSRVLMSADALWQNGFGVVFPELEGVDAFSDVGDTLNAIEVLDPLVVVPGHGPYFVDVVDALSKARSRLDRFMQSPDKHRRHAVKVLIKFRLLELQRINRSALLAWCKQTSYTARFMPQEHADQALWLDEILSELALIQAVILDDSHVINA